MSERPRGSRSIAIGRAALAAGGIYVLVVAAIPLVDLLRLTGPDSPVSPVALDRNALLLGFLLWAVYPAAVLLIAAWRLGVPATGADRLLRASGLVMCAYVALGGVASVADPSTAVSDAALAIAAAASAVVGSAALLRWSRPAVVPA